MMSTYEAALRLAQLGGDPDVIAIFIGIELKSQREKREAARRGHPTAHRPGRRYYRLDQLPPQGFRMTGVPKSTSNALQKVK